MSGAGPGSWSLSPYDLMRAARSVGSRSIDVSVAADRLRDALTDAGGQVGHPALTAAFGRYATRMSGPLALVGPSVTAAGERLAGAAGAGLAGDSEAAVRVSPGGTALRRGVGGPVP